MKYIVELGRTDGYIFEEEDVFEFLDTERELAIQKYEYLVVMKYQYKALYEEENDKKTTIKFAIHKVSNDQLKTASTYFVSYVYTDYMGNLQFGNNCFEIDDSVPTTMIRQLEQMCSQQMGFKCTLINYKKIDEK